MALPFRSLAAREKTSHSLLRKIINPIARIRTQETHVTPPSPRVHLAFFHANSARTKPAADGAGVFHVRTSSVIAVTGRFCMVPSQFGNELASMRSVMAF